MSGCTKMYAIIVVLGHGHGVLPVNSPVVPNGSFVSDSNFSSVFGNSENKSKWIYVNISHYLHTMHVFYCTGMQHHKLMFD